MAAQSPTVSVAQPSNVPVIAWIGPVALAWLVPGAGHFMLKKTGRGALIFVSVAMMFSFGLAMGGMMFAPEKGADYLTSLINYGGFLANLASGAFYLLNSMFGTSTPDMAGAGHVYGAQVPVDAGP